MGIIYKNGIAYGNQPSTDAVAMIEPSEEASATSAHAYAVGEHFIYNDTLYRATAAIAIGDTITPNTNCVATNVMTEVESGGGGGGGTSTQLAHDIADEYDSATGVYSVGDYCIYQFVLYKCITAISTPEAFDSTKWSEVTVGDELNGVRNTLNQLIQESAFEIVEENGEFKLYWYGAQGECPYTIVYENGVYNLYFNYTTA